MNHKFLYKAICFLIVGMISLIYSGASMADDEEGLFTSVAPDALIILDLSGSMAWNPAASTNIWSDSTCTGTYYSSSGGTHTTNCSRLAIAKRAIFKIFDDNGDGTISNADETRLNIRFGYMRFYNGDDTAGNYSSGNIQLIKGIGTHYSTIYCANSTSCTITSGSASSNCVNGESASGGTPLASAFGEAKSYLDYHKSQDTAKDCRQKFVIVITDGADTYACSGDGSETQTTMYKRRRETVARVKALADAGYKVFVIGFGASMPDYLENTLNWMAYYGSTDNPDVANAGNTSAFTPPTVGTCTSSTTTGTCDGSHTNCYATSNDPGNTVLSGYAFLAASAGDLSDALKSTIDVIRQANYSFSQASIQVSRLSSENFLFEGSFEPLNNEPSWIGHLKKYQINNDGSVGNVLWDAGTILQNTASTSRNVLTSRNGSMVTFNNVNVSQADATVSTAAALNLVIGYLTGDTTYNIENWKLGDVFRSTPITISTPSIDYYDARDTNQAFASFRSSNSRTSDNGKRMIVVGANDGQLHAFKTGTGAESWSIVPPNLIPKLKYIAHNTHPTALQHQYFVDGQLNVADVWLGTGSGSAKSASDWKTLLVMGEGRGGTSYLWSSSAYCNSDFTANYSTTYPYYCGIYAFDVTTPISPTYKWHLNPTVSQAPYLGDPWGKMRISKVLINGYEKWVGFVGAGYNASDCAGASCDTSGKGFLVVDLSNGDILWSYTHADNSSLVYSMPATPLYVDSDLDDFVDTVYIGDMGGNIWRFKFCKASDGTSCNTSSWAGGLFYNAAGTGRPIYTTPTATWDVNKNFWIHWGTGDKSDPTTANANEKIFGLRDNDRSSTYTISNLDNITSTTYNINSSQQGWYVSLNGEKVLADPTVYGGVLYFTTYADPVSNNVCDQSGSAYLYGINYITGAGALSSGARKQGIGSGIAAAPLVSQGPNGQTGLYIKTSSGSTGLSNVTLNTPKNYNNILYWKDKRLE